MRAVLVLVVCAMVLGVGCGDDKTDKAAEALKSTTPNAAAAVGDTGRSPTVTASTPASETRTATATPTRTPTATATPAQQPLKLGERGWAQERQQLTAAFIIENPNPGFSVEGSDYQVAVYDAAGTVIKTSQGYVSILLPGQKIGVAATTYLSEANTQVARVDIQVKAGRFKAAQAQPTFTAESVVYRPDRFSNKVTGIVKSPYQKDVKDIQVFAIAYDAAGVIIGGGLSFLQFVPAGGQAAAEVPVITVGVPAKVELYPVLSSLSLLE